jgi:hypothetical protein
MRSAAIEKAAFLIFMGLVGGCAPAEPEDVNGHKHYYRGTLLSGQQLMEGDYVTQGSGVALWMQGDCNLVFSQNGKPLWASHTERALWCHASMQTDGNFVVYDDGPVRPVFATGTAGYGGSYINLYSKWNPVTFCVTRGQTVKQLWWCSD